jgi:hypothetical protein
MAQTVKHAIPRRFEAVRGPENSRQFKVTD